MIYFRRWYWLWKDLLARDAMARGIAWMLPRRVTMWAAYRVGAHATTGEWGDQSVPDLKFMDALDRWEGG